MIIWIYREAVPRKLFNLAPDHFSVIRRKLPSFVREMDQHPALYADGLIELIVMNLEDLVEASLSARVCRTDCFFRYLWSWCRVFATT